MKMMNRTTCRKNCCRKMRMTRMTRAHRRCHCAFSFWIYFPFCPPSSFSSCPSFLSSFSYFSYSYCYRHRCCRLRWDRLQALNRHFLVRSRHYYVAVARLQILHWLLSCLHHVFRFGFRPAFPYPFPCRFSLRFGGGHNRSLDVEFERPYLGGPWK